MVMATMALAGALGTAGFVSHSVERHGTVRLNGTVGELISWFTAEGERAWAPGWDPRVLHAGTGDGPDGTVWTTSEHGREMVWITTRYEPAAGRAQHVRVEPGRLVARIEIELAPTPEGSVARVTYVYTGLGAEGNAEIEAITEDAFRARMASWEQAINRALEARRAAAAPGRQG